MKFLIFVAVAVLGLASAKPQESTPIKYDNVKLEEILKSDSVLKSYVNCFLDKGTCSPDGTNLKKILPDALLTDCAKCTKSQKEGSKKLLRYVLKNKADWWKDIEAKFDKQGVFRQKNEGELKNEGPSTVKPAKV